MLHGNVVSTGMSCMISLLLSLLTYYLRFIGLLSNSSRKAANVAGFYKGIQAAGAAVMWSMDNNGTFFEAEFISNWALLSGSLLCAAPVIFMRIKDHVTVEEDL
jgi:hypothetical protein